VPSTIEQWQALFNVSIAEGDFISRLEVQEEWSGDDLAYKEKEHWAEGIFDFRVENHPVRVALAQARYIRAIAEATGQTIAEQRALADAVRALADETTDVHTQLAALNQTAARNTEAQIEISRALGQIAEHLAHANHLCDTRTKTTNPYRGLPGWLRWLCRTFGPLVTEDGRG
jgi:hypothetical protein